MHCIFLSGGARNLRLGMPDIKKIEANTQYNGQLSYHGHNKSIIINSASLLQAGAGALALGWRGACGLPCRSCRCWDGEGGRREPNCNAGLGDRRRAEGRRRTREDIKPGDRGSRRAASRENRESNSFACWAFFARLCWIETFKLYMILSPSQNKCSFWLSNFVP